MPFKIKKKHLKNNELPPEYSVDFILCVALQCKQCSFLYLCCVHSQLAGKAMAATAEPHLTNRLAPAGGRGLNRHCGGQ